jgi:GTP diphosphokinase / guanosine-3',5'-bis(diphosphate) 3'-diphosphatase
MEYTEIAMPPVKEIIDLMPSPSKEDAAFVEKAYNFALDAHKNHKRLSGEPYFIHLFETAKGLAGLGMTAKVIAAGFLHDSIEDVQVKPETIEQEFGKEVRFLVEGVTKLGKFKYHGRERHRESLRKLLVATGQDARVLIIKLMDRLHNMRTLDHIPEPKRQRIALETIEIYAAIAHRLGMGVVRKELEDLAFKYAYPEDFAHTTKLLSEKSQETQERLETMIRTIKKELAKDDVTSFETDSRVKGLWSLWQKLKRKGGDISKIHDIAAIRIVVDSVADCYRVLGIVNNLWQPLPNKIKDYIAFPKPNGYKSLHTTVFAGDGGIVEIQIRTREMHQEAQYGIAAHVTYKEPAKSLSAFRRATSFDWIKSLLPGFSRTSDQNQGKDGSQNKSTRYGSHATPEWLVGLNETEDDPDFETTLKNDLFSHHVFVFTPQGDAIDLPAHSSPIDFAYAIHTDIGDHIFGAKVNGKMVSLNTELHNGDIVEIETRKSSKPSEKWLSLAKTSLARRHIRNLLEQQKKAKG